MRNSIRAKKRINARTVTIRTQWAKNRTLNDWLPNEFNEDFLFNPCKSNPNTRLGWYVLTNPNPDPIISKEPEFPKFDNEELEYLKSLWLNDDTEFEMNNTFELSL